MEGLDDLVKLLAVDYETDVHEGRTLRDHIYIALLQRSEGPLQHSVELHDVLSNHGHLRLVVVHDDLRELRELLHDRIDLLSRVHGH